MLPSITFKMMNINMRYSYSHLYFQHRNFVINIAYDLRNYNSKSINNNNRRRRKCFYSCRPTLQQQQQQQLYRNMSTMNNSHTDTDTGSMSNSSTSATTTTSSITTKSEQSNLMKLLQQKRINLIKLEKAKRKKVMMIKKKKPIHHNHSDDRNKRADNNNNDMNISNSNSNMRSNTTNKTHHIRNSIKLHICHNEYDLFISQPDVENDTPFYKYCNFSIDDIQTVMYQYYKDNSNIGNINNTNYDEGSNPERYTYNTININNNDSSNIILEYYEDMTWKPIIHINDIIQYKGGNQPIQIRVPQYYDDTPLPEEYVNDMYGRKLIHQQQQIEREYTIQQKLIITTIQAFVYLIKYEGYERSTIKVHTLHHMKTGVEISTQRYIIQRLHSDIYLQKILLYQLPPNSIYHIIEMIHYDFVWYKYN